MQRKVIFIGGIHGVGKSTLCNKLATIFSIPHYSASQLIRKAQDGLFTKDKTVVNVSKNQDVLLSAINEFVEESIFLLDGHFALFDANRSVQLIPDTTFSTLDLSAICVLTCDIEVALERIANRDGVKHNRREYEALNNCELAHAKMISEKLSIPIFIQDTNSDIQELTQFIKVHLE